MADETINISVPAKNQGDKITTFIGVFEAVCLAVGDVLLHPAAHGAVGVDWTAPTFWLVLVIAIGRGLHGYYTNKGTATQVVTKQTGDNATVNVDTTEKPSA